jgi:phosphatidylinositol alpha-mannosyltransferase
MRIVLTHVYAWPEVRRGGERYLHEVASGLAERGHEVRILTTAPTPQRARIRGVEVVYLRRRRAVRARLSEAGRRRGVDIGTLQAEMTFGMQALARLGGRSIDVWHALGTTDAASAAIASKVRHVRSVYTDLGIPTGSWREARPDRRLYRFMARNVDRYICLSSVAERALEQDFGRRGQVLGGGVDLATFEPAARNGAPAVLFTSDVNETRKNFRLLVDAMAIVLRAHPDAQLWVAGPGDPTEALARATEAVRLAAVHLGAGALADLPGLYARAWVTALPSDNEAFGLVVLESLASGTPAVVLDGEAPSELVGPETGVATQPTAEGLAEAIARAFDLARDPSTAERCRTAAQPYDWRTGIVPRLEEIYCEP